MSTQYTIELVAQLRNELTGKIDNLRKEIKSVGDETRKTSRTGEQFGTVLDDVRGRSQILDGTLSTLSRGPIAAVGIASVAAAAGLAVLISTSAQTAAAVDDMRVRTSLSTDAIQEYTYAGADLGFTMDAVAQVLKRAATPEAEKNFRKLGVATRDANGQLLEGEEILRNLAVRMEHVTNRTERDAIAMATLGRSASEIDPMLRAVADGSLKALSDEAHRVGAIMSKETVAAADAMGDSLAKLNLANKAILANSVAPFFVSVESAANNLLNSGVMQKIGDLLYGMSVTVTGNTGNAQLDRMNRADELRSQMRGIDAQMETIRANMRAGVKDYGGQTGRRTQALRAEYAKLAAELKTINTEEEALAEAQRKRARELTNNYGKGDGKGSLTDLLSDGAGKAPSLKDLEKSYSDQYGGSPLSDLRLLQKADGTVVAVTPDELRAMEAASLQAMGGSPLYDEAGARAKGQALQESGADKRANSDLAALQEQSRASQALADEVAAQWRGAAENIRGSLKGAFLDSMQNGRNLFASLFDAGKQFVANLAAELLSRAAIFALVSAFTGGAPLGGFGAYMLGGITGRAAGGDLRAGQTSWVGENGPEMWRPHQSGYVTSNTAVTNNSSRVVNITINGAGSDGAGLARKIAEAVRRADEGIGD